MKVLISDDDPVWRLLMGRLIRNKLGYEAFETSNGLSAWQILDSGMIAQLCILDMWMPELNGVKLLAKLRADPRFHRQKVILCSAENRKSAILEAASLGVSGYLLKPFDTPHFLDMVKTACEGKSAPRESPALGASVALSEEKLPGQAGSADPGAAKTPQQGTEGKAKTVKDT